MNAIQYSINTTNRHLKITWKLKQYMVLLLKHYEFPQQRIVGQLHWITLFVYTPFI